MPADLKKEVHHMQRNRASSQAMGLTMTGVVLGMLTGLAAAASALFG